MNNDNIFWSIITIFILLWLLLAHTFSYYEKKLEIDEHKPVYIIVIDDLDDYPKEVLHDILNDVINNKEESNIIKKGASK